MISHPLYPWILHLKILIIPDIPIFPTLKVKVEEELDLCSTLWLLNRKWRTWKLKWVLFFGGSKPNKERCPREHRDEARVVYSSSTLWYCEGDAKVKHYIRFRLVEGKDVWRRVVCLWRTFRSANSTRGQPFRTLTRAI
jgi:hypothetical protein